MILSDFQNFSLHTRLNLCKPLSSPSSVDQRLPAVAKKNECEGQKGSGSETLRPLDSLSVFKSTSCLRPLTLPEI